MAQPESCQIRSEPEEGGDAERLVKSMVLSSPAEASCIAVTASRGTSRWVGPEWLYRCRGSHVAGPLCEQVAEAEEDAGDGDDEGQGAE